MDNIISLLLSFNKISLLAFFVTVGFVVYQIHLIRNDFSKKKNIVSVPDFKTGQTSLKAKQGVSYIIEKKDVYKRISFIPMLVGLTLLFVFGLIFLFGLLKSKTIDQNNSSKTISSPVAVTSIASKGIKIYNQKWQEMNDTVLGSLKPGDKILIGISTVPGTDIDSARIRINGKIWSLEDITIDFNKKMNSYYREYTISSGSALLKIEAQLHSKIDGWLGD